MRLALIPLLLFAGAADAQILQRIIPGRAPPPPVILGIDALRADFVARSGSDKVYFGGDSAILTAQTRATLVAQALWLRQHPELMVRIEGHADASDTRDHALAIGARRAEEVRNYLILLGVPAPQLTALSWGKERPAVMGTSPEALALDRRAVTVLLR